MNRSRRSPGVPAGYGAPKNPPPPAVAWVQQLNRNWCWAACAEMILRWRGEKDPRQCVVATRWLPNQGVVLNGTCCDTAVRRAQCVHSFKDVERRTPQLYQQWRTYLVGIDVSTDREVRRELSGGLPVLVAYEVYDSAQGPEEEKLSHLVVVRRFVDGYLEVLDPMGLPADRGNPPADHIRQIHPSRIWPGGGVAPRLCAWRVT